MRVFITLLLLSSMSFAQGCKKNTPQQDNQVVTTQKVESAITVLPVEAPAEKPQVKPASKPQRQVSEVDKILEKLNNSAKKIETYKANVYHLTRQPMFDSQTLRTGVMYYQRKHGQSLLRIDFNTLKQDQQPVEKYIEQFYFDGIWLSRVDYQLKEVKKYQLVDPNDIDSEKGVDAFDLISEHLPIVGFTGTDKLKNQFDISLAEPNENDPSQWKKLRLKVKPDSRFKDDWVHIDFWIDTTQYLPVKMVTLTTEDEIYELGFKNSQVNQPIDSSVFKVTIPAGFTLAEEKPLKKKETTKK